MEEYDLEYPADVVVTWIMRAVKEGATNLDIAAWREFTVDDSFKPEAGGYEETDVSEVTAVGTLEVKPQHPPDSWLLRVRVEDELGDRVPEDESVPEEPEDMDLDAFWHEFIEPKLAMTSVVVEAAGPAEKDAFDQFIRGLERKASRS
jgi:hypothetical protein